MSEAAPLYFISLIISNKSLNTKAYTNLAVNELNNEIVSFSFEDPKWFLKKKTPKSFRTLEYKDNVLIISLRTVGAFGKQSCGLFLAPPQKLCFEDPKWFLKKKTPKSFRTLEYKDNVLIISLRTVGAFGKQSCGLFLAPPQKLCFEDPKWFLKKKTPKSFRTLEYKDNVLIISLRTEVLYELP